MGICLFLTYFRKITTLSDELADPVDGELVARVGAVATGVLSGTCTFFALIVWAPEPSGPPDRSRVATPAATCRTRALDPRGGRNVTFNDLACLGV